jgi:ubiquinone/menaquinone biosynthesis C-methylase UbiE
MSKRPVSANWFDQLHTVSLQHHFEWLSQLRTSIESVVNFGCWKSSEPFALLWALDATEVVVVEEKEEHLAEPKDELERLKRSKLGCLEGRSVRFITADMSTTVTELPTNHFDLAYCEDVLYYMQADLQRVQNAINEMARVVKPGSWVIAIEPKLGATFEEVTDNLFSKLGREVSMPVRVSDPEDISSLFEAVGLERVKLEENAPAWWYCYRKPFVK